MNNLKITNNKKIMSRRSDLSVPKSRTRDIHRICSFGNPEREMHIKFIHSEIPNERCTSDLFIRKSRTRDAHRIYSFGNPERKMHIRFIHSEIPNERCTSDLFIRKHRKVSRRSFNNEIINNNYKI
jgi:hypothetical protein